jgi:hypothetical protein
MFVRVLSTSTLLVGVDPLKPTHSIDLSTETIRAFPSDGGQPGTAAQSETREAVPPRPARLSRRSGDYWFKLKGKQFQQNSLKELLCEALRQLEELKPGTLQKLSAHRKRSRRIVSRDPKGLFRSERLASKYAEKLTDDWWYGTNNSAVETDSWLALAADCAGLTWFDDMETNLGGILKIDLDALD